MVKINYFILYMINLVTALVIMSLYDKNFRFLFPLIITLSILYTPILLLNIFLRTLKNSILKNLLYVIFGILLYCGLMFFINGKLKIEDILIFDLSGFMTIYSFIFYMIIYTIISTTNKRGN